MSRYQGFDNFETFVIYDLIFDLMSNDTVSKLAIDAKNLGLDETAILAKAYVHNCLFYDINNELLLDRIIDNKNDYAAEVFLLMKLADKIVNRVNFIEIVEFLQEKNKSNERS